MATMNKKANPQIKQLKIAQRYLQTPLRYSHLSKKRDVKLTDFRKFHPAQNLPTRLLISLQNFQYSYRT